jgi:hypothetical protein
MAIEANKEYESQVAPIASLNFPGHFSSLYSSRTDSNANGSNLYVQVERLTSTHFEVH